MSVDTQDPAYQSSRVEIINGRVIDPANRIDEVMPLYIADGRIAALGNAPSGFRAEHTIDAREQIVIPGLVDLRARLREPGEAFKGTIASETLAAACAGVTSVCCPPDTHPVIDSVGVVEWIHEAAQLAGRAHVYPLAALTRDLDGRHISEMHALKHAGCVGVSNVYRSIDTEVMRRAMEYAHSQGLTVYLHPQDTDLARGGCVHEGVVSVRLGLPGIPESAETVAVARDLQLVRLSGVRAHFCQLSSAKSVQMLARAQYDGIPISADVAVHQLFLTEMDIGFFNSQCHVIPPLRTLQDRDALRQALRDGALSALCSDHQPHDRDAKLAPFPSTEPGMSTLETLLPLSVRLVEEGVLTLPQMVEKLTLQPARILDIDAGTLTPGKVADVCVFHPNLPWLCNSQQLVSCGKNSPFLGWEFNARVTHTLFNGRIVYHYNHADVIHSEGVER